MKDLEIYLKIPPLIYCDNISVIALASNRVYYARTKHIELDYHFIREKVICRDIQVYWISSVDQVADIFTKGLSSARLQLLKDKLHVKNCLLSLRGDVSQANLEWPSMAHLSYHASYHDR